MPEMSVSAAIISCKCPKCRTGNMFKFPLLPKWYNLDMHTNCQYCGQIFEPEPGFYYGAMFVSYGFSVAITFLSGLILFNVYDEPPTWIFISLVSFLIILFLPVMFKYSRSIFLHLVGGIRFDPNYKK